jgi:hypothetical protein
VTETLQIAGPPRGTSRSRSNTPDVLLAITHPSVQRDA